MSGVDLGAELRRSSKPVKLCPREGSHLGYNKTIIFFSFFFGGTQVALDR